VNEKQLRGGFHAQEETTKRPVSRLFLVRFCCRLPSGALAQADQKLTIDIPVKLEKANVVFDIGKLVLNGHMTTPMTPIVIFKPVIPLKPAIRTPSS
jgi:hypothetical protein